MPLFAGGFCYIIPLACGGADALTNVVFAEALSQSTFWFVLPTLPMFLVLPALLLNYAGQTALLADSPPSAEANPFFDLCPPAAQIPLVILATFATVIASQSIITGAFSMTRQAIQLGLLPRIHILQTSEESYGQIYVGFVNWALMTLTLFLTAIFRSSDSLAAAFGIAVSLTMLLTSVLMFIAMREVWRWSLPLSLAPPGKQD